MFLNSCFIIFYFTFFCHNKHRCLIITEVSIETAHPFTKEELDDKLKTLGTDESLGHILRSKGIVKGTDGKWFEFDFVSGDYEIRECTPDVGGRMCVIGEKLDAHKIYDLMKG